MKSAFDKFTVSNSLIKVELEYIDIEGGNIFVLNEDVNRDIYKEKIKKIVGKFSRPNWKNYNEYIQGCLRTDPETGLLFLDQQKLKQNKFKVLLRELVDDDGSGETEEIPLTSDFFARCIPEVANGLVDIFDRKYNEERRDTLLNDPFVKNKFEEIKKEEEEKRNKNKKKDEDKEQEKTDE